MQKKNRKLIKIIIISSIAIMLLLLLIFSKDMIKLKNSNNQNIAESIDNMQTSIEANIPKLSAGMIPIKWNGESWIITSKDDTDWYDYSQGKPAYIMLNDGTYQSEIQVDMTNKKLALENVGVAALGDPINTTGTIFMWIPRFAYNEEGNIKYIKGIEQAEEGFTIPDLFMYKQADETKPNFLLTGVWVEKDIDTNYTSKITQMNKEESIYGFIANTKATQITTDDINSIQTFVGAGLASGRDPMLTDIDNTNRIILKIINDKNQDPIKANASYNKETGLITVQVTYSQYGISKILLQNTTELTFAKTNGITKADTKGIDLEDGENVITLIDNKENKKELKVRIISKIYAMLYTDGTLAFGKSENALPEKTIERKYGDISGKSYSYKAIPWRSNKTSIITVDFVNKISPISTRYWFYECDKLATINNIENLNTENVTNMGYMFYKCSGLTVLDVSNFDTSNVTDMKDMFSYCSGLTGLDVSNFNTRNVTDMSFMFRCCSSLTELEVSNFDTGNVTDMSYMFQVCRSLTGLDLSNFDTQNVTSMYAMFYSCENLTNLDLSNFDTSNITDMGLMFYNCSSLTTLNVSNFDTSKVTDMDDMFYRCSSLTNIDVSHFDTSKVTDMSGMFCYCSSLTSIDVSNFDTSNVTNMNSIFWYCSSLTDLDLSSFNTENVTDMRSMFGYCGQLKTIYVGENWKLASDRSDMFTGCGTSTVIRKIDK